MKLYLLKPFVRFGSTFVYSRNGEEVIAPDCRLYYVKGGSLKIHLKDGAHILPASSVFYCPSETYYKLDSLEDGTVIYSVNFDLTQDNRLDTIPRRPVKNNKKTTKELLLSEIAGADSFLSDYKIFNFCEGYLPYFEKIIDCFLALTPLSREYASVLLNELLILFHNAAPNIPSAALRLSSDIRRYLDENYKNEISLSDISDKFGYNQNYLGRIFSSAYGTGIIKYILQKRLTEAKRLMLQTDLPLTAIAESVGFNDYAYFSAYFRKSCSLSPRQYRIQCRTLI